MLSQHHSLLLLLLPLLLSIPASQQQEQTDDAHALLEFKKGIHSDPSGKVFSTWNTVNAAGCPQGWHGVVCDGGGGDGNGNGGGSSVVNISLSGLGLSGEVKLATLINMRSLRFLDLSGNNLTGRLPPSLRFIASLQHLDLSSNQFYGPVPDRIVELWSLTHLNLSYNAFSGWFPSGIKNLQQLRQLDLRSNQHTGDVAQLLSELMNVEYVDLSGNQFKGQLSISIQNFSRLGDTVKYLNLSSNIIVGPFFSTELIIEFKNLEVLDVSNNELTGELPKFDSLTSLKVLRAGNNFLRGPLPEELLGSSQTLTELVLSKNGFTGSISNISSSLQLLNLSSNALSGYLPYSIGSCTVVDLSNNNISGDFTSMLSWGGQLEVVDLGSNNLSGNFPNLTSVEALKYISIRNNSVEGVLPSMFGNCKNLGTVDFSLNKFQGPLLSILFTLANLRTLNLSGNHLDGSIVIQQPISSESLSTLAPLHMESLDLSQNNLSGSLPAEITYLQDLTLLDLHGNSLSGAIPSEIGKLSFLKYLDLSSNQFKDRIPDIPQSSLQVFKVSNNDLSGHIPSNLLKFPVECFRPGNPLLIFPNGYPERGDDSTAVDNVEKHRLKSRIRLAVIVGSIGTVLLVFFMCMAIYRIRTQELCGKNGFRGHSTGGISKLGKYAPRLFRSHNDEPVPTSMSFSNDNLLTSLHRSASPTKETDKIECEFSHPRETGGAGSGNAKLNAAGSFSPTAEHKSSCGSPKSPPLFGDQIGYEKPVVLDVYSPDRLVGELFFLDKSLLFTAEELSRAPAEVLGRSSHGTSYKATLDNGHMLTVKWLRVGLVKQKKDFAKEVKKIGAIKHQNLVSLRGYYWGPREQERLILADYILGDSLALHLYEATPRRYARLTLAQRLKIAGDIARSLCFLHLDKCLPHGNLKPTNILLSGPNLTAQLTDYGLHRLMTLSGISEQVLNLGALGYRAPELASATKPSPTFKADVYAFGVILMELLTRRSAGDIISGQSGAVDLTDWVQMCAREGRLMECFDRDIAGVDEAPKAMDDLLAVSLRCILPVDERPNIRTVFEDLCSIEV